MNRWTWNTFLFANGGRFFNEDETAAAFNSPKAWRRWSLSSRCTCSTR